MKMPVSICETCPQFADCDYPCTERGRNLGEFRKFESKLRRKVAKGIARTTGVPWKSDLVRTTSNYVTKKVIDYLRE